MANIIIQDVREERKRELAGKQDTIITFAALMGRGDGARPDVDGREGYVWVRVGHAQALQMAYNSRVMPRDDLAIYVGYMPEQPNLLQVISVRQESYVNTGQGMIPVVKDHHLTHEWGGGDDVWIAYRRLVDLHLGQPAGFVVTLNPGLVYRNGAYMWITQQTIDLSGNQPAVGAQARYVLVYLDALGVLSSRDGTIRPNPTALLVSDIPVPLAGELAIAAVRLYASQTAIGDDPDNRDIVELREFQPYSAAGVHELLSATHDDTTTAACVLGDIITGQAGPLWKRLAISVPAANIRNVLGVDNGETGPSWKAALDANNPTTIGIGDAAAPGTSLIFSHRDHQHASPATWTATAHNLLSAIHGDTVASAVSRGDLVVGVAGPSWDNLALGGGAGSLLTRDANDVLWSTFYLTGHATRTYHFPDYDMTLPAADAHGYLHSDGAGTLTWDAGAGGAAAGNDTNVQFNNGGAFGGSDNLTWDDTRLMAQIADAATNTVVYPLRISHITSNTAAAGFGVGIQFQNEDAAGTAIISGIIASAWLDPAANKKESRLEFRVSLDNGGTTENPLIGVICSPRQVDAAGMVDGNARGNGAVDFQAYRTAATQVASGRYSAVIGGSSNTASSVNSVVIGGNDNTASGAPAAVIGGSQNTAAAPGSVVVGGNLNTINLNANYAVAMGQRATIGAHAGVFMFSDSTAANFNSAAANEFAIRARGKFRHAYDDSYYYTIDCSSAGDVTFDITHAAGTPVFEFTHAVHMTNLLVDHIGEHTGAHKVIFDNSWSLAGIGYIDHIAEATGAHGIVFDNDVTRVGKISVDHIAEATGAHTVTFDNNVSVAGNLTFTSTARRIYADMDNATTANRLCFQTSTTNAVTVLQTIPNGTSTISAFIAYNGSDPDNAAYFGMACSSTEGYINVNKNGTGSLLPLGIYTGGSKRIIVDTSGNMYPNSNKSINLGAAGSRWNTLYQGTSTAAGTSRLVRSTRLCPVCKTEMVRGTGSLCILGEMADYEVAQCPKCGTLATEEMKHLPDSQKAKRKPAPQITFVGFHVFEMSGNSRKVRVDFDYGNDVKNSTYLGETELAELLAMTEKQRGDFLKVLGQREWDALEETRLMQETCASLQSELDAIGAQFAGKDL